MKKEKIGSIKGNDLLRQTRGINRPTFRSGRYLTEKDRPRKKVTVKNMNKYL